MPFTLSRAAESDLATIADYTIRTFGEEQAILYRDGLIDALDFLARFPKAARQRTELRGDVRAHPYRSHLIFYRPAGDDIFILRIRHAREDWTNEPVEL